MVRIGFVTCVLLIALRLAIGWHVTYEGLNKYESTKRGKTETNRPFNSQGYFAEAEGPLGPKIRDWLGDADHIAIAKLTLKPSNEDKPSTKMPEALDKGWNEYARQFEAFYKLNDDEKKAVETKLEKAKNDFVLWRTDFLPPPNDGEKKKDEERKPAISISAIGTTFIYRGDYPVERRFLIYDQVVKEIRQAYEVELPKMGRDVEKTRLRDLKSKAAEIRADLMRDVDLYTMKMREALSKIVAGRLGGVDFGAADDPAIDDRLLVMLTSENGAMPSALEKQWDDYLEFVRNKGQDKLKNDTARSSEMLADAKTRYVRFLLDRDQYTGDPLAEKDLENRLKPYREAVTKRHEAEKSFQTNPSLSSANVLIAASIEPIKYRQSFMDDIRRHTEILRQNLGGFASDKDINRRLDPDNFVEETIAFDNNQGTIRPEKETVRFLWHDWPTNNLEWMNWATRWGLLIAGLCILFGLFTRLACLGVAAFLLVEILSNTPFPWLPTSPKSEGSYAFVNKNTVEMLALLLLATLPTGRWLGLDALLSCIWPFRRRTKPTAA